MKKEKRRFSRRWPWLLGASVLLIALLILLFNYLMDPYGAFGDPVLKWWSYDETLNPKVAKISYLEKHHLEYDSYIVGSSGSSSYPVEALNDALDAHFYNCFSPDAKMRENEKTCRYLLEHYPVRNLLLNLSPEIAVQFGGASDSLAERQHYRVDGSSAVGYTLQYLFVNPAESWKKLKYHRNDGYLQQPYRLFDEKTGAYDRSRNDAEPIGTLAEYLQRSAYAQFGSFPEQHSAIVPDEMKLSLDAVARIRALCTEKGVRLIVVCQPDYFRNIDDFSASDQALFRRELAKVTDYWDFTCSSVSYEPRYFYDADHFRSCVGRMAVARMFEDERVYFPEDFGEYVPLGADPGVPEAEPAALDDYTVEVPILMYHDLFNDEYSGTGVSEESFDAQMAALCEAGYHTVSVDELRQWVEVGTALPEKPIVITFDDGYASVYRIAFPILQKYGMKATTFAIGVSVGKTTYKDTGVPMIPHYSVEEAAEMVASGLISVQSHGYNIHEVKGRDPDPIRKGITQRADESEADYVKFVKNDCATERALLEGVNPVNVLSYPESRHTELSEVILSQEGFYATITTFGKVNLLVRGLPQSLRQLGRLNVVDSMTGEDLVALIEEKTEAVRAGESAEAVSACRLPSEP